MLIAPISQKSHFTGYAKYVNIKSKTDFDSNTTPQLPSCDVLQPKFSSPNIYGAKISFGSNISPRQALTHLEKQEVAELVNSYKDPSEKIEYLGMGTFGIAYKITLPSREEPFVVKKQKASYDGEPDDSRSLENEAKTLREMPNSLKRSQRFIDSFNVDGTEYLVSTLVKGQSLKKQYDQINQNQFNSLIEELAEIDKAGIMIYDLDPRNLLRNGDNIGIIDFEFTNKQDISKPNLEALGDVHHLDRNLFHPRLSSVNAFENMGLGGYIVRLDLEGKQDEADSLVKTHLKALSGYYASMAENKKKLLLSSGSDISGKAVMYDEVLSGLFKEPSDEVVSIEKNIMGLKATTLDYYLYHDKTEVIPGGHSRLFDNPEKHLDNIRRGINKARSKIDSLYEANRSPEVQMYCQITNDFLNAYEKSVLKY